MDLTLEKFISTKLSNIKVVKGDHTGNMNYIYSMYITENQVQFIPKPNTESMRQQETEFFIACEGGFRLISVWRRPKQQTKKAATPPAANPEIIYVQAPRVTQNKTKTRSGTNIEPLYPSWWNGPRYANGYKGKKFDASFLKKTRKGKVIAVETTPKSRDRSRSIPQTGRRGSTNRVATSTSARPK